MSNTKKEGGGRRKKPEIQRRQSETKGDRQRRRDTECEGIKNQKTRERGERKKNGESWRKSEREKLFKKKENPPLSRRPCNQWKGPDTLCKA